MIFKIDAVQRKTERKSDLSKLRREGFIPAVVYGKGIDPIDITMDRVEFMKLYKKSFNEMVFYEVMVAGKEYHTLLKERQIHPVSREILHVDFMVIPHDQMIEVDIPLKFTGTPNGVKEGGSMDVLRRTLRIQCLEKDIPEDIEIDVSNLQVGEAFHIYQLPEGKWNVKDNPDNALVTIHAKKAEVVAAPVEEVQAEEPAAGAEESPEKK
ncbi:MAG: 50S ribosomal protein L25 [Candidatus Cloacimonadaceae bacterium]